MDVNQRHDRNKENILQQLFSKLKHILNKLVYTSLKHTHKLETCTPMRLTFTLHDLQQEIIFVCCVCVSV